MYRFSFQADASDRLRCHALGRWPASPQREV